MSQMQRVIPAPSMALTIDLHLQHARLQLSRIPRRELGLLRWADSLDKPAIALRPSTSDSNRLSLLFRRPIGGMSIEAFDYPACDDSRFGLPTGPEPSRQVSWPTFADIARHQGRGGGRK
ncbi:hypothetical protein AB0I53_45395 [Saccharopolyspora sp. NPDC050389]|uniref:hypothetical protein n=1 Tax=Saccharopolyspora sp. NPDC050389 TaxID=3155516 RepID=UPI0033D7DD73